MANQTGTGSSTNSNSRTAATEAVTAAISQLKSPPRLGFVFASAKHDLRDALAAARAAVPNCEFLGCGTAGEFTDRGLTRGGLAAMVIGSDSMLIDVAWAPQMKSNHEAAAKAVCEGFNKLRDEAALNGVGMSTTLLLVDGLAGTGERLVKEVMQHTRSFQQVVGGAAGDDAAFKATWVGAKGSAAPDSVAAAHVFDAKPWGVGVDHGLRPTSKRMTVSKADRSTLYEIDGRPAFEAYKEYAASKGVKLEAATAAGFMIANELGVYLMDQIQFARAPVGVGPKGELNLVADINQGASICFLDGDQNSMAEACGRAATEAKANLKGADPAGVLVFDCVCRGIIFDKQFQQEIDAIRNVFPNTPVAGFLTYGEIAKYRGKLEGWHNTTAVIVAIPA